MGDTEWRECLERLVDWANFLDLSPNKAFIRIAKLLKEEHFGIEYIQLDNWDDFEDPNEPPFVRYLNMGDTYATTLIVTDDYVNGVKLMVSCWGDWYETNVTTKWKTDASAVVTAVTIHPSTMRRMSG